MPTQAADRKALVFADGGVVFALRLTQVREILSLDLAGEAVAGRGGAVPALPLGVPLGLARGPSRFAVVTESRSPLALLVEEVRGIADLAGSEVFQLPARTALPRPPPFVGSVVAKGAVALEVAVPALGFDPIAPAADVCPPPAAEGGSEQELVFARGGRRFAVPLSLLVQVLEDVRVWPVPLAPPSHRGLLYHGRSLHPVFDVAVLYGCAAGEPWRAVLLVDAGGTPVGLVADRVLGVGGARPEGDVLRPPWDALFGV